MMAAAAGYAGSKIKWRQRAKYGAGFTDHVTAG